MKLRGFEELLSHGLTGSTFEEHVVRKHHGGATGRLEQRANVLEEVELLVRGRRPEVLPVIGQIIALLFTLFVRKDHAALLTERRIGQHVIHRLGRLSDQGIRRGNERLAVDFTDVVEKQVHQA